MINMFEVNETNKMITQENLDVRTITLGISLLDCVDADLEVLNENIYRKITTVAKDLVATGQQIEREYGIPIVNKRISITPIAFVGGKACKCPEDYVSIAKTLDRAAKEVGVNFIGGYSALVSKGMTKSDENLIRSIPEALSVTERVCSSVNVGSTKCGINMDAVRLMGKIVKQAAEYTREQDSLGCAKLVVFCNAPDDNPFMAGAFHGVTEADAIINVGVSGPGVVKTALEQVRGESFEVLCETIKKTAFKVTRVGQLVAQEASRRLGIPFGIIDLSLAPTPAIGDSVADILCEIGLEHAGAPGTTAALALLNDNVKKGGVIICLAECPEGCSKEMDDPFEEWLGRYPDKDSVVAELKRKVNMGGLNCYKVRECQAHCRLILITALDQKRMAEVNVECYPKEQLNEVIRTVLAEYDHPKVLYMPQATLTLPLVKE